MRVKSVIVIFSVTVVFVVGAGLIIVFVQIQDFFRSEGTRWGASVPWKAGTVAIFDYCWHPGSFNNQVEWVDAQGTRRVLLKVGDSVPSLKVSPNGELVVTYCHETDRELYYVRAVLEDLDAKPIVTKHDRYPDQD